MRDMDAYAIDTVGIPSDTLMLRAARGLADKAEAMLPEGGMALILCGSGNNGGDGIAAGKYLLEDGFQARLLMIGNREKLTQDSRKMCALLEQQGGMLEDGTPETVKGMLPRADLVIDALFGTGLSRDVSGAYADIIAAVNASECPVLACDIASGISADTGEILGCAVRADATVTFNLPKTGQLLPPGTEYTGALTVHDIGIPEEAKEQVHFDGEYVTGDHGEKLAAKADAGKSQGRLWKAPAALRLGGLYRCGGIVGKGSAAHWCRAGLSRGTGAGISDFGVKAGCGSGISLAGEWKWPFWQLCCGRDPGAASG